MTLKLTRDAFQILYGANNVFVVGASLVKKLPASVVSSMTLLVLASDGTLCSYDEAKALHPVRLMAPMGAPLDLAGFAVARSQRKQATEWADYVAGQSGRGAPAVKIIPVLGKAKALFRVLMVLSNKRQLLRDQRLGQLEGEVASLRQSHERALAEVEKARRMLRAVGFDTRMLMATLPVGDGTVCQPDITTETMPSCFRATFLLPVNAIGLQGISLHCVMPQGEAATGRLTLAVYRAADSRCLGQRAISYAAVDAGWIYFELDQSDGPMIGEARLVIEWHTQSHGVVPAFSAADTKTKRFGALAIEAEGTEANVLDDAGVMPALQLWSGINRDDFPAPSAARMPYEFQTTTMAELLPYVSVFSNGVKGAPRPEHHAGAGWLQTSVSAASQDVMMVSNAINQHVAVLEMDVENTSEGGHPCLCIVAAVPVSLTDNIDIQSLMVPNAAHSDLPPGCMMAHAVVLAGQLRTLAVELPLVQGNPRENYDIVCATVATEPLQEGEAGLSRWHQVRLGYHPEIAVSADQQVPMQITQQMQAYKFIEIADRLKFLAGDKKLTELSQKLGFSPMMVTEDNGSLQTHPISEAISATVLPLGAAAGTCRVMCEVETAHERSPDFIYVLALIKSDTADKYDSFKKLTDQLVPNGLLQHDAPAVPEHEHYCVKQVGAMRTTSLSIDLVRPLDEDHDIVFAALPIGDLCSYGWCRWQFLAVARGVSTEQILTAASGDENASEEP